MLFVDFREGSKGLVAPLRARNLPVEETELEFGDIMFEGRGVAGAPMSIGIEYKKLPDLLSSLQTGRLQGHQAVGMNQVYAISYLLIEGEFLYDRYGGLLRRAGREIKPMPGGMTIGELRGRLNTLHVLAGMNPKTTKDQEETCGEIEGLYRFWTDRDLDQHKSHLAIYRPPTLVPLSQFRKTITTLPDMGLKYSLAAQKSFKSIKRAINASADKWAELESVDVKGKKKRLGNAVAGRIVDAINKE